MSLGKSLLAAVAAMLLPLTLSAQAPIFDASRPPAQEKKSEQQRSGGGGNVQEQLYFQLQQLQQEVTELHGRVEEQEHQLRQLKQQSLDRYIDLDRRIGELGGTSSAGSGEESKARPSTASQDASEAEIEAYRQAYELVRAQKFSEAIPAFENFVAEYPGGRYAPNAWYWLGELYLVKNPQDLGGAEKAFRQLLESYPENSKVPDAKYKLGKVFYQQGKREEAKRLLNEVVAQHGSNSAAKLADQFLRENF